MSINFNLTKVTSSELCSLLELAILNQNIKIPGTGICFELFIRQFHSLLKSERTFTDDIIDWSEVTRYISSLSNKTGFSKETFRSRLLYVVKDRNEIPLEIIYWLEECNIMYFEEYCLNKSPASIVDQITNQLQLPNNDDIIVKHILLKLILASYNTAVTNVAILSCIQCTKIIDDMVDLALCDLSNQTENVKLLDFVFSVKDYQNLYDDLLKKYFKVIINKAITLKEKACITDAYIMQELWSTKKMSAISLKYFHELITFHSLTEYIDIINASPKNNLNWRMVLTILASYVNKIVDCQKILKDLIQRRIYSIFSNENVNSSTELIICVLMARQFCFELENFEEGYSEWYSQTFGPNSNLRTGIDVKAFSMLLTILSSQVTKEPQYALKAHIDRSIRTPPGCQSDMLVYKDICRSQLIKVQESPKIVINNTTLCVHTILEHALNSAESTWGLKETNISQALLPYIQKDAKYLSIKHNAMEGDATKIDNAKMDEEVVIEHIDLFCSDSEELFE